MVVSVSDYLVLAAGATNGECAIFTKGMGGLKGTNIGFKRLIARKITLPACPEEMLVPGNYA